MEMLNIAIPNKGRLSEKIYDLLNCAGLVFPAKDERSLQVTTKDKKYSIIFVRTQDIPMFVENGIADIGFTGFDILTECKANVDKIMDLDFGYCEMIVAVKEEDSYQKSSDLPQNLNRLLSNLETPLFSQMALQYNKNNSLYKKPNFEEGWNLYNQ